MKLSGIEIRGFKSFCDHTRINFGEHNIISIIGPNGCGKSNVVDALRWVVGEQSAKNLRGQDMKDVIFSGTKSREQSGLASVTLYFDNFLLPETGQFRFGDFSEIAIGRRLYRSGASEYLINNTPSRLKDVRDIFLDTGVGGKGYSIIEQGMIGRIITCRPEERMYIVEEAAGVLKFRVKKQETDRKLGSSKQNLLRINDLLAELTERETSLGKQVERAEKFIAAKSTIERLSGHLLAYRWHKISEKNEQYKEQIKHEDIFQVDTQAKVDVLGNKLETLRLDLFQCEESRNQIYREIETLKRDISSKENELKIKEERVKHLKAWKEREQLDITEFETRLQQNTDLLTTETEKQKQAENLLNQNAEELNVISERKNTLKEQYNESLADKVQTEKAIIQLKEQLSLSKIHLEQQLERLMEYKEELNELKNTAGDANANMAETELPVDLPEMEIHALKNQIDECAESLSVVHSDYENALAEKKEAEQAKDSLKKNINSLEAEHLKLKSIIETITLKNESAKHLTDFLHNNPNQAKDMGYLGIMSRLFSLKPETPKEIAIVWEHFGEVFVFSGQCSPETISRQLKELDVKSVVLWFLEDQPAPSKLFGGQYPDFLHYLEPLNPLISITLPEHIFSGPQNFNNLPESVLSKSAYWFNGDSLLKTPVGLIHFNNPNSHSVLAKDEENRSKLASMEREMLNFKTELANADNKLLRCSDLAEELSRMKTDIEEKQRELKLTLSKRQYELEAEEKQRHFLSDMNAEKNRKIQFLAGKISPGESAAVNLKEKIAGLEKDLISAEILLKDKEPAVVSLQTAQEDAEAEWHTLQLRHRELEGVCRNFRETINRLQNEQADTKTKLDKIYGEYSEKFQHEDSTHSSIEEIKTAIPKLLNVLRQSESQLIIRKNAVDLKRQEIHEAELEKNEWLNKANLSDKQKQSLNLKQAETQKEMLMMGENLQTTTGFHPGEIIRQIDLEIFNEKNAEKDIEAQRQTLNEIGNVNMEAFDEFKALKERLTFLREQHEDLTGSINALESSIEALESETQRKFMETFNQINQNLKKIFAHFFGGGSAELIMVGEESDDKRGIDIMVDVPGKTMRHLNLLSGGEKAMSALALIFSIFMIKPSPFCVLDEVDAPLDEANVKRFCKVLKIFSEKTRFIVVTHNKVTMESSDLLIGVTMGEPGVSKTVSVRIADYADIVKKRQTA